MKKIVWPKPAISIFFSQIFLNIPDNIFEIYSVLYSCLEEPLF